MGRLHELVRRARHDKVKAEIASGSDVNAVADNLTPLEIAIHGGDVAMVDILIRAGADVNNGHPNTGKRPLHDAVIQEDLRILELLLEAGADVEGFRETSTPLCTAAEFGKREAYDRLIEAGANPQATRRGKVASELLASGIDRMARMRQGLEPPASHQETDKYAQYIKKMMAKYPTVQEYAAHRGHDIYIFSLDRGVFSDPEVGNWARTLGEILRSSELLEQCQAQFLSGSELEKVRRVRKKLVRWHAREQALKHRVANAAQGFVLKTQGRVSIVRQ